MSPDTAWNAGYSGCPTASTGFSIDGDDTTFNDAERELDPERLAAGRGGLRAVRRRRHHAGPGRRGARAHQRGRPRYGSRLLVTPSTTAHSALCGSSAAASRTSTSSVPPTVATTSRRGSSPQTMGNNPKYIAEAASHEVGHNFSLTHDGTTVGQGSPCRGQTGYYCGHDMWSPIMGVGYYTPLSQWSKGEYQNANNGGQDDMAQPRGPGAVRRGRGRRHRRYGGRAASRPPRDHHEPDRRRRVPARHLQRHGEPHGQPGAEQPQPRHPARAGRRRRRGRRAGDPASTRVSYDLTAGLNASSRPRSPRGSTTPVSTVSGSATR